MKAMALTITAVVLFVGQACAGVFSSYPSQYSAEPIEGRVIDKETGKPIEGVIVVAQWVLAKPLEGHETDYWMVIEAVTDAEGRYRISGWGPLPRPSNRWLTNYDPELVLFKPEYWPRNLINEKGPPGPPHGPPFNPPEASVRKTAWNGKDILLYPFKIGERISPQLRNPDLDPYPGKEVLSETEWADQMSRFQIIVDWGTANGWTTSEWLRIQNFIRAIERECLKLPEKDRIRVLSLPDAAYGVLQGDKPCR